MRKGPKPEMCAQGHFDVCIHPHRQIVSTSAGISCCASVTAQSHILVRVCMVKTSCKVQEEQRVREERRVPLKRISQLIIGIHHVCATVRCVHVCPRTLKKLVDPSRTAFTHLSSRLRSGWPLWRWIDPLVCCHRTCQGEQIIGTSWVLRILKEEENFCCTLISSDSHHLFQLVPFKCPVYLQSYVVVIVSLQL